MAKRLIDATKEFRPVYAIYRHEYLGCLVSAHVVQELSNGRLSLQHQGLVADNMDQFAHKLDDVDRRLLPRLKFANPNDLIRKFAPKAKNPMDFFLNKFKGEVKSLVLRYISRQMAEVIPYLEDRELYVMGKDGYPAAEPVRLTQDRASLVFNFVRTAEHTRYFPRIELRGERVRFRGNGSAVLCNSPAWMLANGEIFTFDQDVDGKKLVPFLQKPQIMILPATEATYYRKFMPQIIESYRVRADGFAIEDVDVRPQFRFVVGTHDEHSISMNLRVHYGDHELPLDSAKAYTAIPFEEGGEYRFYRVCRDQEAESDVLRLIEGMNGNQRLMAWDFMSRQEGLRWLSDHVPILEAHGVEVIQQDSEHPITFDTPEIELETEESGDWFDIRAVVKISGFRIPFIKFKRHILKGIRDYVLPDGKVAILPESWFSDYRHLVEIAEERDEEVIAIRKYQAVVLEMPGKAGGQLRDKIQRIATARSVPEVSIPDGLQAELRSYQKKGYDWLGFLQEFSLGGILADDMGLGKTLQTLSLLQHEKEEGVNTPSMVVMPTSLVYNWMAEAQKFTPGLRILVHTGVNRARAVEAFTAYDLVLTTYGIVRQDLKLLKEFPFHYIILDESQMIKNPASKTARAVKELHARHRLSLTGTPLENSLMDLWSQMTFLNPGLLGSETFFKKFYAQPIEKQQDEQRKEQLKKLIHPFILRRTKEQVAHELPPKIEQLHYCEMTEAQKEIYEETKNAYRNYLLDLGADFGKKKLNILAGLQKLRQIAIHPALVEEGSGTDLLASGKYREFGRLLDEVLAKGAKVLVFSQFVRLLKILREDLQKREVDCCYLDGATRDRQAQVQRFQNDPDVKVFLISLKAGGVGLNLTAAEYVFILDPWWNPAVEAQAIDRSHRIGQQNTVFSYKFITRDSIEEKIIKLQERKSRLSNDIVSVETDIFKSLNMDDLQDLLA